MKELKPFEEKYLNDYLTWINIIPKIILKIRKNIEVSSIDIYLFKYFFLI